MTARQPTGPYVVWQDYGYEGWHPNSFGTLSEAVAEAGPGEGFVITKIVQFEIIEKESDDRDSR